MPPGAIQHGGDLLTPVAQIRPVYTPEQVQRKIGGASYQYMGGLGLYPILDGVAAADPWLTFDGETVRKGKDKVATCAAWFGDRPTSKKVRCAPGVDGVLVLALLSEWDANRRGAMTASEGVPA